MTREIRVLRLKVTGDRRLDPDLRQVWEHLNEQGLHLALCSGCITFHPDIGRSNVYNWAFHLLSIGEVHSEPSIRVVAAFIPGFCGV